MLTSATDLSSWIALVAGGGGILTLLAGGIIYVTKEAITKAVTQAGAREIERLKGDLAVGLEAKRAEFATELERERASFTRDIERERASFALALERERQGASRDLERFKSELSLDAEGRRQVVTARLDALSRTVQGANALAQTFVDLLELPEELARRRFSDACLTLTVLVRATSHLFPENVGLAFERHVKQISDAAQPGFAASLLVPPAGLGMISEVQAVKARCFALTNFARTLLPSEGEGAPVPARSV